MTQKEHEPKKNKKQRERFPKDLPYNPDITEENKKVLNNQSAEERKKGNLKDREKPVDYTGDDLDVPKDYNEKFNPTRNKPDQSEREKRPKRSANTKTNTSAETVYKGKDAEKYSDPSKKSRS